MAISGVGGSQEPIKDTKQGSTIKNNDNLEKKTSIFDLDKNGEVSVDEILEAIKKDETINNAVKKGFNLEIFLDVVKSSTSNIPIFNENGYKYLPNAVIASANKYVQGIINIAKEEAADFLNNIATPKKELKAPMNVGEGWGLESEHIDYVLDKLEQVGVPFNKELFIDTLANYDYGMDKNNDSMISPEEVNNMYDGGLSSKYLNKDKNGKAMSTPVLDWILNVYIERTKNAEQ